MDRAIELTHSSRLWKVSSPLDELPSVSTVRSQHTKHISHLMDPSTPNTSALPSGNRGPQEANIELGQNKSLTSWV